VIAESGAPVATVAVGDRVDPSNAPRPATDGERLLFRQIYETLVRIDCQGRIVAGLAASWRLADNGRTWMVTLRDEARFSDGSPVISADIRSNWTRAGAGDELLPEVARLVESVAPLDDRTLAITLHSRRVDAPWPLAHADLAIAKAAAGSRWPLGTRVDRARPEPDARDRSATMVTRDNVPAIRFLVATGDPRDVLDKNVDLVVTRDPAALDYAAALPQFQSLPLEWQHAYVLVTPRRARSDPSLTDAARRTLANDAIRGEAQGAAAPFWWDALGDCTLAPPVFRGAVRPPTAPQIVYDARDAAARDLSERLVGLVRGAGPAAAEILSVLLPSRPQETYDRAVGLTGEPLARALRLGNDAGYVLSVDRRPLDPCRDAHILAESAPWLDLGTIVAVADTRLRAIVRRGRSGITAEWDGGLLLAHSSGPRER
jgi:hypothetical protein